MVTKLKVLHIAAGLPSEERPYHQPFIKTQINSLRREGIECGIYEIAGYNSQFEYLKSLKKIKEAVKTNNYDLIHAHYSYCGLSAYFSRTGKPIVLSFMGSDLLGRSTDEGKITFRGRMDNLLSNYISKKVDHIIVKSLQMKNLLSTDIPVSVVPNGVDFNLFNPNDSMVSKKLLGFNKEDFLVLFLGNKNVSRKNFKLAKESFDLFFDGMKDPNIKFLNPFGSNHKTIADYMNASNVLLLTSFWEGSPNVVKEAMACNLPIISTDVGDVKNIVSSTFNCYIVNYSKEEISGKLKEIYNNRKRSNGREKIDYLQDNEIAKKIINIYQSVLNGRLEK